MCVTRVREAEYAAKLIHRELANIPDLELWWLRDAHTTRPQVSAGGGQRLAETDLSTHLELDDLDLVGYDGRFVALIEGGGEHLDGIGVELVRETGPLESEGHGWLAGVRRKGVQSMSAG